MPTGYPQIIGSKEIWEFSLHSHRLHHHHCHPHQRSIEWEETVHAQTAKPQAFQTGDGWFPYNCSRTKPSGHRLRGNPARNTEE